MKMLTCWLLILSFTTFATSEVRCKKITPEKFYSHIIASFSYFDDVGNGPAVCFQRDCSLEGLKKKSRSFKGQDYQIGYKELSFWMYSLQMASYYNQHLRLDLPTNNPSLDYLIRSLSCLLKQLPNYVGVVNRVVDKTFSPELFEKHLVGSIIKYRAFTSTTTYDSYRVQKAQFKLHSKTGKSISDFAFYTTEREVLFDQGTCFKVMQNKLSAELEREIELEEVSCPKKADVVSL